MLCYGQDEMACHLHPIYFALKMQLPPALQSLFSSNWGEVMLEMTKKETKTKVLGNYGQHSRANS